MNNTRQIFLALVVCLSMWSGTRAADQLTFECIDNMTEFKSHGWRNLMGVSLEYAETTEDLPEGLRGNLKGNGIFYVEGTWNGFGSGGIIKNYYQGTPKTAPPVYVYVRYYGHADASRAEMYVTPVGSPFAQENIKFGPKFEWQEAFVEIDYYIYGDVYIGLSGAFEGEYILYDKLIFAHSGQVNSMEEIKGLCGWNEGQEETTTTTTTTQAPFVCQQEGSFADPQNCSQFHVCQDDDLGGLIDNVLTCPEYTVWCQRDSRCDYPSRCPCSL